ncbi:MAG: RNA polymerase sigma factor RpoD/SigA [Treponema sp.]|nr:RNA polymerase sigma factor RpoD/SigA [Treponema sp.]
MSKEKDVYSMYLSEINKIPLLSLEEEKALATRAVSGDKLAQKKLVEANLRLVIKIANKYQSYMNIQDLISEGNLGLMHAAEKYSPCKGAKFSSYAALWIKAYIHKGICEKATGVKIPANKYKELESSKWQFISLDKPKENEEDGCSLGSLMKDEQNLTPESFYYRKELLNELDEVLDALNLIEKKVIVYRYGLDGNTPKSLSELAAELGGSKERIRQIEKRALSKIRDYMEEIDCEVGDWLLAA